MEAEPISKNGASLKSHTNRSKWNMRVIPIMLMMCFVGTAWSQTTYNIQLGTTYSETVESGSYNRYAFSVTKEGMLTVNISTDGSTNALPYQGATFRLLNSSGETLKTFITPTGFPYSDDYSIASIGDYQIEISSQYGGTFKMRADCFVDEAEPNNTISTALSLPNSGCTARGTLSSSDVDMYKYVLTQPGRFTVKVERGTIPNTPAVRWLNSSGTQIKSYSSYSTSPYNDYMDLEAGTYYVEIKPYSNNYTGTYSLIGTFTAAENNEIEPNDTRPEAQSLTLGQTVKGFISYQDNVDMYKYVLTQPGRFTVNITRGTIPNTPAVRWLNSSGTQIMSYSSYSTSPYNDYMDLEAGTYYVEIKPYSSNYTGTYSIIGTFTAAENNETEPNDTRPEAQSLTFGQTLKGFFSYQDNIDMYQYVLTQPGKFTVNIARGTIPNTPAVRWLNSSGTQIKSYSSYSTSPYNDYMDLEAGTYYVEIKPYSSSYTGTYTLTGTILYLNAATPTITEQPIGATYTHNATATALSVTATTVDGGTLTYQWYRNTTNSTTGGISVGTDHTYIPPTTSVGTYYYYVEVTNTNNSVIGTKKASVTSNAVAVEVTATQTQTQQTITFNALPVKTYGDENFTLSASASSGLPVTYSSSNTNVATVSGNTITIIGVGEASITASQAGNAEYAPAAPVTQILTVGKAPLSVTADNKSRKVGEPNPELTYSISGFKNSETQSVIDVLPTVTTTATQASSAGSYPITASGASDNNYDFTYQNGTLTITAAQTYTVSLSANPTAGGTVSGGGTYNYGSSCTVTATANSGYTFTNWTENGSQVSTNANYSFTVTANRTLAANFTTNAVTPPTVTTLAATNITQTTATLNKSVTEGSETIIEQGFKYKQSSASSWTTSASGSLTGLTADTQYEVYAYATTATGTTNGTTLTFKTTSSGGEEVVTWEIGYPNAADVIATLNLADGTLTVSGTGAMQDFNVISYGPWHSSYRNKIQTVVIEDGVTNIGDGAFGSNDSLTAVTIGNTVETIGFGAFGFSHNLTIVNIPNSVTTIGGSAFANCNGLTSITIPNSVTTIGGQAFIDCNGLTSIMIPESVVYIGSGAFRDCTHLTSIDVSTNNQYYSSLNGVLFNKNKTTLLQYPAGKTGGYTIPESVTTIGNFAFSCCYDLTSIIIPNSVTTIGNGAFSLCNGLTSITIPNSVTSIDDNAFRYAWNLTDVTVNWTTPLSINSNVFEKNPSNLFVITLHVPCNTYNSYAAAPVWQEFNIIDDVTASVTGITLNQSTASLSVGNTLQLTQTVLPSTACNQNVSWTSTDNNVATVADGLVTAVNAGTCAIIATTQDGNFMVFCNITVTGATGIAEVSAVQLSVYPNPVREELFIKSETPIKKVEIYTLSGVYLLSENNFNEKLSVSALPKGVYLLKVYTDKGVAIQKIVKE
jgi:uncharacterized protein YjdB